MLQSITLKLLNQAEIVAELEKLGDQKAAKALQQTVNYMKGHGPQWIARVAKGYYALPGTKLNPNTKAGKGSVSASGSTIASVAWHYTGERLHIGGPSGFKVNPTAHKDKAYQVSTQIIRGQKAVFGHWAKPWSEDGAYGKKSPWMMIPGLPFPVQRMGSGLGEGARGLSVPQMVLSKHTKDQLEETISNEALKRLEYYVGKMLAS